MYCKKCRYVSFDHLNKCPKCGLEWNEERKKLGIDWMVSAERGWLEHGQSEEEVDEDFESQTGGIEPDKFEFNFEQEEDGSHASLLYSEDLSKVSGNEGLPSPMRDLKPDVNPGFEQFEAGPEKADPEFEKNSAGLEPDLGFDFQEETVSDEKRETPSSGRNYEIDYPGFEIFDPEEKK